MNKIVLILILINSLYAGKAMKYNKQLSYLTNIIYELIAKEGYCKYKQINPNLTSCSEKGIVSPDRGNNGFTLRIYGKYPDYIVTKIIEYTINEYYINNRKSYINLYFFDKNFFDSDRSLFGGDKPIVILELNKED